MIALATFVTIVMAACRPVSSGAVPDPAGDRDGGDETATGALELAARARLLPEPVPYTVRWVVDGDTLILVRDDQEAFVRLIGIDAPESVDRDGPVECFGAEAAAGARALAHGRDVYLAGDPSQDAIDRYGRRLAYVWLDDGTLLNLRLVRDGLANEYTYDRDRPYRLQRELRAARDAAAEQGLGFWSPATCGGDFAAPTLPPN